MLEGGPWDFFMTAFCESHVAAHQFWHLRDPRHSMFDPAAAEACAGAVEQVYEAVDSAIGRLLEVLPPDATVVVLTQQGVASNFSGSHLLPEWLARRSGFKGRQGGPGRLVRAAARLGSPLRIGLHQTLPDWLMDLWLRRKYAPNGDVFMLPGSEFMGLLRVDLRGREPRGTVAPDDYRRVIETLREDLLLLRNPDTGRPAVREVVFSRDRFHGSRLGALPDVIVCWANDAPIRSLECPKWGTVTGGLKFVDRTHSLHTAEGLAFIAGPRVRPGVRREPIDLPDLTATFYRLMGEDVPPHVEGIPLDVTAPSD
jgi:predicted AlkP superfamily phosphohydrolase/phosphomutase